MIERFIIVCGIALLLGGCSTQLTRTALDSSAQKQLTDVKAQSAIWQDEVIVRSEVPGIAAAAGGGLLVALIDSKISESRQGKVQEIIDPFYASVDDVDFRQQFWEALSNALHDNFPVKVTDLERTAFITTRANLDEKKSALAADKGFMNANSSYTFSREFSRLNIQTSVDIYQGGKSTPVYSNIFFYQSGTVGKGGPESINAWAANKGERYRLAITEGIAQIIKMLKIDIASGPKDAPQIPTIVLENVDGSLSKKIGGPLLDRQQGRAIARNSDGRLYSLPVN